MLKVLIALILISIVTHTNQQLCGPNQFVFGDTCLDQCPDNTAFTTKNGINQCQLCDLSKFLVLSEDKSRCVCAKRTYWDPSLSQCLPCHYSCLTCNGPSTENCEMCDSQIPQTFRYRQGGQCLCPQGYFDDKTSQSTKCLKCHQDCEICSGPDETQCVKCGVGRIKNEYSQCICAHNFVQDSNGKCYCPYTIVDGSCKNLITQCGYNQQSSYSAAMTRMIAMATLTNPFVRADLCQCRAGLIRIKGQCTSCKSNQVFNKKNGKCDCAQGGTREKGQCILCYANQTYNKKTKECSCRKNEQKTLDGSCIKCPNKSVYSIQQSRCICIFNYFEDPFSGRCRKCNKRSDSLFCTENVKGLDLPRRLNLKDLADAVKGAIPTLLNPNIVNPFNSMLSTPILPGIDNITNSIANITNITNSSSIMNNSIISNLTQMFKPVFGGILIP